MPFNSIDFGSESGLAGSLVVFLALLLDGGLDKRLKVNRGLSSTEFLDSSAESCNVCLCCLLYDVLMSALTLAASLATHDGETFATLESSIDVTVHKSSLESRNILVSIWDRIQVICPLF